MFSNDADQEFIRAVVGAGVTAYSVEGLAPERLAPIIDVALARFAPEAQNCSSGSNRSKTNSRNAR